MPLLPDVLQFSTVGNQLVKQATFQEGEIPPVPPVDPMVIEFHDDYEEMTVIGLKNTVVTFQNSNMYVGR